MTEDTNQVGEEIENDSAQSSRSSSSSFGKRLAKVVMIVGIVICGFGIFLAISGEGAAIAALGLLFAIGGTHILLGIEDESLKREHKKIIAALEKHGIKVE